MPVGLVAAGSGKQAYLRVRMKTGFVIRPEMRSASLDAASIAGNAYRALSENGYRAKGQTARKQFSAGWRHALKGSAAGQAWMTNHEFRPEEVFYMKKVIINENQKGFLFHNGRFVKLLGAGKYPLFGAREIEIVSLKEPLISAKCELDTLLANSEVAKLTSVCEVADQQLALHYTSGKFDGVLRRGKYAFWSVLERHEYQLVDISTPEVAEDVPQYIFAKLPTTVYTKVEVAQYQKARLYFDQKLIRILDAGTYYFWKTISG